MPEHLHLIETDLPVAPVRWEPCATFRVEVADDPVCHECGWPAEEHRVLLAS